jgi:hypothetical protein
MIRFICDTCKNETDFIVEPICINEQRVPGHWITIDWKYYNDREGEFRKLMVGNGLVHFCSQQCLIDYLFYKPIPENKEEKK